jgi:hypothetical protein
MTSTRKFRKTNTKNSKQKSKTTKKRQTMRKRIRKQIGGKFNDSQREQIKERLTMYLPELKEEEIDKIIDDKFEPQSWMHHGKLSQPRSFEFFLQMLDRIIALQKTHEFSKRLEGIDRLFNLTKNNPAYINRERLREHAEDTDAEDE